MNARELLGPLEQQPDHYLMTDKDETETILRALRLLAAAESNDGTTPETDILIEAVGLDPTCPNAEYFRRIARERNGLAAMVGEYESTDLCGPGGPCKALASSYAALAERDAELANERKRHDQTAKEGMDERDERKRLEADLAKLKGHAEAMAKHWEQDDTLNVMAETVAAYRADFREAP